MIVFLVLMALAFYLVVTKTKSSKKTSNNKFRTQFGMAVLVGVITINTFFISSIETPSKYIVIGIGIMSFIAILIEMIIAKKKQTTP